MVRHAIVVSVSVVAIVASQCGGSTTTPPHTPKVHRETAITCDSTRPPGITDAGAPGDSGAPDSGLPDQCNQDSDCTNGKNGRCSYVRFGKQCSYDTCNIDADCANGGVCVCRTSPTDTTNNHCVGGGDGACRVDADCGPKGACSPSLGSCGTYSGVVGYFCHSSSDTCVDDSECTEGRMGYCMYVSSGKKWQCSYAFCAG